MAGNFTPQPLVRNFAIEGFWRSDRSGIDVGAARQLGECRRSALDHCCEISLDETMVLGVHMSGNVVKAS